MKKTFSAFFSSAALVNAGVDHHDLVVGDRMMRIDKRRNPHVLQEDR
ncbi:MAG: hypothetical protein ABSA52_16990 [Candidatus Binatia bacterium]